MKNKRRRIGLGMAAVFAAVILCALPVLAGDGTDNSASFMYATIWSLLPPMVAIVLALITKEVYSSLFFGILVGALFSANFQFEGTVRNVLDGGFIKVLSNSSNVGILIFLVVLGTMVCMMNRVGGSAAFGKWAGQHIKTRIGAQIATIILGMLIFVDDYFNCLTVGSVMRPITDKHNVSKAKLSYLIDATAAPICIIAPISSWAAAVSGFVEGEDGLAIFIQAIPYNFYALLTIIMMVTMVVMKIDYGPMTLHEENALKGDIYTTGKRVDDDSSFMQGSPNGKVIDLVFPVIALILCCIGGMVYTGGFFQGVDFVTAFSKSEASIALSMGSLFALLITIVFYYARRVLKFGDCMECVPAGFKAMVPAILILTFAWTLKAMTDSLGAAEFVSVVMKSMADGLVNFLPAIIFLVGAFLAFATGTSWGTFGILIPIVVAVFENSDPQLMIISISACMAGAVCGDHCSPISDTTIMASAGAQCNHVNHVATQLPYAMTAAGVSFVTYIVAGFTQTALIALPVGIVLMIWVLFIIKKVHCKKQ